MKRGREEPEEDASEAKGMLGVNERNKERRTRTNQNRERAADTGSYFENEIWLLLDRMQFDDLNAQNFRLDVTPDGYGPQSKQIDVLGRWRKEVLVIECKAAEGFGEGLDRQELSDYYEKKKRIVQGCQELFAKDIQVHIAFWLKNIVPRPKDTDDCRRFEFALLDYEDYREYFQTAKVVGAAAKFRLLAELYQQKPISPRWSVKVPAITGSVSGYQFYSFVIEPQKLLPLASVPRRRPSMVSLGSETGPTGILYQRMLIPKKLREVEKYIGSGGFFPNNLVVAFNQKPKVRLIEGQKASGLRVVLLTLPNTYGSLTIIDGQHRLFGFSNSEEDRHQIPVMAFEALDPNEQGKLFVDINSKQKKVDSNLLWDLHEYFGGSYRGALSLVVKELGRRPESPVQGRILIPSETAKIGLPLKMTALCTALDSARILRTLCDGREGFQDDDVDFAVDFLIGYFRTIRDYDNGTMADWQAGRTGYLCSNNGISTLVFLLDALLRHVQVVRIRDERTASLRSLKVDSLLERVSRLMEPAISYLASLPLDLKNELRRSSSKGQQVAVAGELEMKINEKTPDFGVVHAKAEFRVTASQFDYVLEDFIIVILKQHYGASWYVQGVDGRIRQKIEEAARKKGRDVSSLSPEEKMRYGDLGTLGQIIIKRYSDFQPVLHFGPDVFEYHLSCMGAYRGGRAPIHTGETDQYLSMIGRGIQARYYTTMGAYIRQAIVASIKKPDGSDGAGQPPAT